MNAGAPFTPIDKDELFAAIGACAPIGLFQSDADGNFTFTNDAFQALAGFTLEQSLGTGWGMFIHPEDRELITESWLKTAQDGRSFTRQARFLAPSGDVRRVVLRSAPVHSPAGDLRGHVGTAEDVSYHDTIAELERYKELFDAAADAVLVADRAGTLVDANRTAAQLLGYSREEIVGMSVSEIVARESGWVDEEYEHLLDAGQWRGDLEFRNKDGNAIEMDVRATVVALPAGGLYVAALREASDQRRREREQERLLRGLADASVKIASSHDLQGMLRTIIERASTITGATKVIVSLYPNERWPDAQAIESVTEIQNEWADTRDRPVEDDPSQSMPQQTAAIRRLEGKPLSDSERGEPGSVAGMISLDGDSLSAPLIARDGQTIGRIQLFDDEANDFDAADEAMLVQLAQLASASIENQRFYQETQAALLERDGALRLLEQRVAALAQVAAGLTFDHPLNTALQALAMNVVKASAADAALVGLTTGGPTSLRIIGSTGLPSGFSGALEASIGHGGATWMLNAIRTRQLAIANNLQEEIRLDPHGTVLREFADDLPWRSAACLPLIFRDRILGALVCFFKAESGISREEARFIGAIANQAAAAIETARLFTEAQGKAALEERQRLARELHDSISQVLYGIGVGASAIRNWLDTDPVQAIEPTEYVLSLVRTGIAEMRSLIFELRPESLAQEGLVAALEKQVSSLRARTELQIRTRLGAEPEAPLEYKEALFRVGQEALNNAAKHARASKIDVQLETIGNRIEMQIVDDGISFDSGQPYPGHFGLQTMRERIERLHGKFDLKSAPGLGTHIRVELPVSYGNGA